MKIDLHVHTKCSDGTDDWKTVLTQAEHAGVKYLSITDHNTVDAYLEMQNPEKYFSGKIIKGIEPECFYQSRCIELLGYNIDVLKMNELLKGVYKTHKERSEAQFTKFYASCIRAGVKFSPNILNTWDREKHYYAGLHFFDDMKKYPENRRLVPDDESWNNGIRFYRNYASNKKSLFYIDESDLYPSAQLIYKLIKQTGGKVFIPHIFLYGDDSLPFLESLTKEFQIDGVECFYNSFTKEQTDYLLNFCRRNNLMVSAGSDYHGSSRPHITLGVENTELDEAINQGRTIIG